MSDLSKLTPKSAALFIKMLQEADYENYISDNYKNMALMDFSQEEKGNLVDLKKKGLVETSVDDESGFIWVEFTNIELTTTISKAVRGY